MRNDGENKACHLLVLRRGNGNDTRGNEDEGDGDAGENWQVGVQVGVYIQSFFAGGGVYSIFCR